MSTAGGERECPFCEIANREEPEPRDVYRDEFTVAYFPTEPAVLGHTMVIPRKHMQEIWQLDEPTADRLSVTTLRIARAIR